ncbi:hypothetical protein IAR55_004794 [Kwoniella newhampshirensis]|uniref:H/ACA ribonucleoprotein complex non-core subunit NAF1 n=1 Tax=Kwoniella newhampshirensis TaxID=1651941 RepID=A0AAW0YWA5_9TREE
MQAQQDPLNEPPSGTTEEYDSEEELEAFLVAEEGDEAQDEKNDPPSTLALHGEPTFPSTGLASASAPGLSSSSSTASPFKLPPNPSIPQDLAVIMEMVKTHQVVGSLPPVNMTAAEKRKAVEESMRLNRLDKGKSKERALDTGPSQRIDVVGDGNVEEEEKESSASGESSSEFESSDEDEEADSKKKNDDDLPLTEEQHRVLRTELDAFVGRSTETATTNETEFVVDTDDDPDSSSDEEDESSYPGLASMGFKFMEDDEDDGPSGGAGPITSIHEKPLPAVQLPPMEKLPEGEGVSLAGDVVSWMRDKKVETWLEKRQKEKDQVEAEVKGGDEEKKELGPELASGGEPPVKEEKEGGEGEDESMKPGMGQKKKPVQSSEHRFTSAGTVVVRAMQSRPGAPDDGWLEEGSVLCWEDGRVLGTVHETFGPLTSPFYTIRLPPPPFPYPSPDLLATGSRLFYPLNPSYRSFVNMLAVRDPRFKGSDASNFYDEEIGEEEMEWSDDEAEAEAKRRRKQDKGNNKKRGQSKTPSVSGGGHTPRLGAVPGAGLPARPHFDYQPSEDGSDAGSMYGGGDIEDERWETGSTTSSTRGGSRPLPAPYEVDDPVSVLVSITPPLVDGGERGVRESRGGRGRGRGQGRERGRGRGRGGRGGRGGGTGHRGGRSDANSSSIQPNIGRPSFPLPPNPLQPHGQQSQAMYQQYPYQQPPQQYPQQYLYPQLQQHWQPPSSPQQQQQHHHQQQYPHQDAFTPAHSYEDTYEPHRPSSGLPSINAYQGQHHLQSFSPPLQHFQQQQQQQQHVLLPHRAQGPDQGGTGGYPAINPRFAAQYQALMMGQNASSQLGQDHHGYPGQGWQGQG